MKNDPSLFSFQSLLLPISLEVSGQQKPIPGVSFSLFLVCGVFANLDKVFKLIKNIPKTFFMVTVRCTCLSWGKMSYKTHWHTLKHTETSTVHLWNEPMES